MVFEDSLDSPSGDKTEVEKHLLPPAIYVRDRMSSNGTWIDETHRLGNPAFATPGYLLRHGQRVSILGEGYSWVFQLDQPRTADLKLTDAEMLRDNEVSLNAQWPSHP